MIVADDEYDLPWTLADITFDFVKKGEIFQAFQFRPLVKDKETVRKYVDPFQKWYEALNKLPSEPLTAFGEPGGLLKPNPFSIGYVRTIPDDYIDEVINFAQQFFDIFLDIYRKAEPVKDAQRRRKMDAFRSEWNKHILGDDPSGQFLIEAFGRRTAELVYDYFNYM